MANIWDDVKLQKLDGEDYIVVFPEAVLDRGYHTCNDIMTALKMRFPHKTFLGLPENLEFKKYSIEELKMTIDFIQKEIDSRGTDNEQSGITDSSNS